MSNSTLSQVICQKVWVLPRLPRLNLRLIWILVMTFTVFVLAAYIFQINKLTQASFLMADYQKKIANLSQVNKNLEIKFSQLNSLVTLETIIRNLNYEKVEKVYYLQVLDTTVVAKPR